MIPEVVHEDQGSGLLSVAYGNMLGVVIEGMKDLARENGELRANLQEMVLRIEDLEKKNA